MAFLDVIFPIPDIDYHVMLWSNLKQKSSQLVTNSFVWGTCSTTIGQYNTDEAAIVTDHANIADNDDIVTQTDVETWENVFQNFETKRTMSVKLIQ